MKLSIITVSYNSAETIEDTIKSVIAQNYSDLEYIIVDGGSKDSTLQIVDKYRDKIAKIVSEPDKGIYDAMNKGINMATGEVVGIINSDDFYFNDQIFNNIISQFENTSSDAVYGDIIYVNRKDIKKQVRFWRAGEYKEEKLNCGWIMPHPAFFVKKEIYNKFGLFNLDFRIAADYGLMLRFLKNGLKVNYLPQTFVCMREGGFSGQSYKQRKKGWQELKKAWAINNFKIPRFFITRRILSKIKQYLFKK
ncbi:MAG TPA: glycosyl transferase [Candidatus Magasanikbacteria bacterium]|nr:glycosyl transferase [Candidatus Magasanikbacteria bacterium]